MLAEGTLLGDRYQVIRVVGEGGMGVVYEAEHVAVRRRVAIKVLLPGMASNRDVIERFEREAQAAAAIGHDNIVEVTDFGRHDGLPFMVMEFLSGESLAARITRLGKLPVPMAAHVMGQVLSALAAAHHAGIVHRDLKPDNVFLTTKAGIRDFVKLLDFGISKFTADQGVSRRSLTRTGALMGTPYYMAPEQALARRDCDHRTDLYAAGVMLYEMLTGRLPFEADSQAELLMAIVYRKPPIVPLRERNPAIPRELEAVVDRAMAADKSDRHATAADFLEALRPFGASASAVPASVTTPAFESPSPGRSTSLAWEASGTDPAALPPDTLVIRPRRPRARLVAALVAGVSIPAAAIAGLALHFHGPPPHAPPVLVLRPSAPSRVQVDLQGVPSDAVVRLDGAEVPARAFAFARGSEHSVVVSAPGRAPLESRFVADRDRSIVVSLVALPQEPPVPPPALPVPPTRHGSRPRTPDHGPAEGQGTGRPLLPLGNEF